MKNERSRIFQIIGAQETTEDFPFNRPQANKILNIKAEAH